MLKPYILPNSKMQPCFISIQPQWNKTIAEILQSRNRAVATRATTCCELTADSTNSMETEAANNLEQRRMRQAKDTAT